MKSIYSIIKCCIYNCARLKIWSLTIYLILCLFLETFCCPKYLNYFTRSISVSFTYSLTLGIQDRLQIINNIFQYSEIISKLYTVHFNSQALSASASLKTFDARRQHATTFCFQLRLAVILTNKVLSCYLILAFGDISTFQRVHCIMFCRSQ